VATASTASTATVSVAGLPVAIASRALAGSNQFDIRLDPPDLGRIDVRLDVNSSGQVTSHVTVDRPDTLALLQNQQPQLERALQQAGLTTADNGLQFTLRDQSFTGQNNTGNGAQQNQTQLVVPDADMPGVDATQIYSRAAFRGGVDIRV
jgi:chemotaxis protein MotD